MRRWLRHTAIHSYRDCSRSSILKSTRIEGRQKKKKKEKRTRRRRIEKVIVKRLVLFFHAFLWYGCVHVKGVSRLYGVDGSFGMFFAWARRMYGWIVFIRSLISSTTRVGCSSSATFDRVYADPRGMVVWSNVRGCREEPAVLRLGL